jgi:hypothetical protein
MYLLLAPETCPIHAGNFPESFICMSPTRVVLHLSTLNLFTRPFGSFSFARLPIEPQSEIDGLKLLEKERAGILNLQLRDVRSIAAGLAPILAAEQAALVTMRVC